MQKLQKPIIGKNIGLITKAIGLSRYNFDVEITEHSEPSYGESRCVVKLSRASTFHTGKEIIDSLTKDGFQILDIQVNLNDSCSVDLVLYLQAKEKTSFNLYEYNHISYRSNN